jgi:hypothetical protein
MNIRLLGFLFLLLVFSGLQLWPPLPYIYFVVYCDKSQGKTALFFAEFKIKITFYTFIQATKLGNLRKLEVVGLSNNFHVEVSLHS